MVTRGIGHALTNRELEQSAEAIEVGMNARYFAESLGIHSALGAYIAEAPAEHFATGTARLPSKSIETGEAVFIDAKEHDAGFGLPHLDWVVCPDRHLPRLPCARSRKTARASSRDSACLELDKT